MDIEFVTWINFAYMGCYIVENIFIVMLEDSNVLIDTNRIYFVFLKMLKEQILLSIFLTTLKLKINNDFKSFKNNNCLSFNWKKIIPNYYIFIVSNILIKSKIFEYLFS